jgi:hypothetical protein
MTDTKKQTKYSNQEININNVKDMKFSMMINNCLQISILYESMNYRFSTIQHYCGVAMLD